MNRSITAAVFLLALVVISCAGSVTICPDIRPMTSNVQTVSQNAGHNLWYYGQITVDPFSLSAEMVPMRVASTHWNILKWLQDSPCTDCFKLVGTGISDQGNLTIDIQIKHPFPSLSMTGFDVRGIAMMDGTHVFPVAGVTVSDRYIGEGEINEPDGYTMLYNPTTEGKGPGGLQGYKPGKLASKTKPTATLNAFMNYYSDVPWNNRHYFRGGDTVTKTFEIQKPDKYHKFTLGYAVDGCWASPIHNPVTDPNMDFGSEANCPEPYQIEINQELIGGGMTVDGGQEKLIIFVYDYGGYTTHKAPVVECPELFDGAVTATFTQEPGSGLSEWGAIITNSKHAPKTGYRILVRVEDNANDTALSWLDLAGHSMIMVPVL